MNIQTLARDRRLLIILTCDTECNPATILMLQEAVSQNMTEIVSSGSYLAEMTKCNECGTMYNYGLNDQCPGHIICPKFPDGSLWKGPTGFQKPLKDSEYHNDTKTDLVSQQDGISFNAGYLLFYSKLKKCSICTLLLVLMLLLISSILIAIIPFFEGKMVFYN